MCEIPARIDFGVGRMRSSFLGSAGLALGAALMFAEGAFQRADSQTPSAPVPGVASRPLPSENLPPDFIDSRPIVAYFDDQVMPDTVRGLLEELKRSDRCGRGADLGLGDACALVLYKLDDDFTPDRLRPPFIMKAIYRVSDTENPADTIISIPDSKGVLQRYAGGGLYHPLRNIRANICLQHKNTGRCTATESRGVLYIPYAILGKIENDREGILPARSARKHFSIIPESAEAAERLKTEQLLEICRLNNVCQ